MWNRGELKAPARTDLKKNYWTMILVCFIMALLVGEYSLTSSVISDYSQDRQDSSYSNAGQQAAAGRPGSQITDSSLGGQKFTVKATRGVLAGLANSAANAASALNAGYNTARALIKKDRTASILVTIAGLILSILWMLFGQFLLAVGERRFFLENIYYKQTRFSRVLFLYREKKLLNPARVMLIKDVFLFLWLFTVIGFPVKYYAYRMVPYLLAENPSVGWRDAITLSRKMMYGSKWRAFVLDISFWYWHLLGALTMGIFRIFFLNPYTRATEARLYMTLRRAYLSAETEYAAVFSDDMLFDSLPEEPLIYPGLVTKVKKPFIVNYKRNYSLINVILMFFTFSIAGWLWEVGIHIVKDGVFVDRGTMYGPWLPIYGAGGMIILILLKKFREKPALNFLMTMIVCGIVEYLTSYILEKTAGMRWWDYSGYLLNINGRICLEGLLVFAIAGSLFVYILAPLFDDLFNRLPFKSRMVLVVCLLSAFCADASYAHIHPNQGKGITDYSTVDSKCTAGSLRDGTHGVRRL